MTITALINQPCTLVHRADSGTQDDYGNETVAESTRSTVCSIQQTRRSEPGDQGEVSDTTWMVFLLPDESLHTGDQVIVSTETYEVTGDPWRAFNPRTGSVSHVEATVRRTAGAEDEVGS